MTLPPVSAAAAIHALPGTAHLTSKRLPRSDIAVYHRPRSSYSPHYPSAGRSSLPPARHSCRVDGNWVAVCACRGYSGPRRSRVPHTTAPAAKMPAVHQKPTV